MSVFFQAVPDSPPLRPSAAPGSVPELLAACLEQTLTGFRHAALATEAELSRTRMVCEQVAAEGNPVDVIEVLARVQGVAEEHLGLEVARLAEGLSLTLHPSPPLIPFAARMITPTAFYERFDPLYRLSRALLSPVIYAEDVDAIGTAALNPIAARLMADQIFATVDSRMGIKPFVTAVRMDYDSWLSLTRKHFSR